MLDRRSILKAITGAIAGLFVPVSKAIATERIVHFPGEVVADAHPPCCCGDTMPETITVIISGLDHAGGPCEYEHEAFYHGDQGKYLITLPEGWHPTTSL